MMSDVGIFVYFPSRHEYNNVILYILNFAETVLLTCVGIVFNNHNFMLTISKL